MLIRLSHLRSCSGSCGHLQIIIHTYMSHAIRISPVWACVKYIVSPLERLPTTSPFAGGGVCTRWRLAFHFAVSACCSSFSAGNSGVPTRAPGLTISCGSHGIPCSSHGVGPPPHMGSGVGTFCAHGLSEIFFQFTSLVRSWWAVIAHTIIRCRVSFAFSTAASSSVPGFVSWYCERAPSSAGLVGISPGRRFEPVVFEACPALERAERPEKLLAEADDRDRAEGGF